MAQQALLDTDGNPLVIGMMYCCVTDMDDYVLHGALVRYCGKDHTGRELFADADTWDECDIYGDGLLAQQDPVIDPATKGWPALSA